jgi:type I restriction enzyme M protein
MDLVNTLWNFCHTLRHEGVDYSDYIEELTYLLFLKIAEERGIEIPEGCTWNDLTELGQDDLLNGYNAILLKLSTQSNILGDIFRQPIAKIRSSNALKKLLRHIDEINWSEINEDVMGSTFEGLLEKAASESKKGAGQYFTPRPLIESIVAVMKPDPFETSDFNISDVACGTSGFIISSFEWFKANHDLKSISDSKRSKLFESTYFGQELVVRPRRMAQMNLYLHGINPANIKLGDTIYEELDERKFSCILTNPPFGNRGANEIPNRNDFGVKTSNKQLNFVQHIFSCLKDTGRAAIVLPDNVLFEEKATEVWRNLMKTCNLHTILKLPNGTFAPYAQGVKANVIFLQKGLPTKETWIYDARFGTEGVTKIDRPLTNDHFLDFISSYGNEPNGNDPNRAVGKKFRKFLLTDIESNGYKLDFNWLKGKNPYESYQDNTIEDVLNDAIANVQSMLKDLKSVLKSIEE